MRTIGALLSTGVLLAVTGLGAQTHESPLLDAVKKGDRAAIRLLLQKRVDVNLPSTDGTTALHWAVEQNDLETAHLLVGSGARVQVTNRHGVSPLYAACLNGNAAMIEFLLKAGADPNSSLPRGETALMTAARSGNVQSLKLLMAHGADVNAKETIGSQTALMWAAAEGHAGAVRALAEGGANLAVRSRSGLSAFLFGVREGRLEAVRALLAAGADVNEVLRSEPAGGVPPAPGLPPRRGDMSLTGMSALGLAIANAHYDLAAALLEAGANPNDETIGWTPLHQLMFTRRPNPEAVVYDVPRTARVDSIGLAKALLAHGADVNAQMKKEPCLNSTSFGEAGYTRPIKTPTQIFLLPCIDAFGNRNNMNRMGATPFLLAAKAADAEMMQFLASNGANPLLPAVEGVTPLMAAAGVGIYKLGLNPGTNEEALAAFKVALALGGDINTIDANGDTALHGAALRDAKEIVQLLLERGAKHDVVNSMGWTPLTIADGVPYTQTLQISPETAGLLRKFLAQKGLPVPPPPTETTTGIKSVVAPRR